VPGPKAAAARAAASSELAHPAVGRGGENAEARGLLERHADRGHGDVGVALAVRGDHLAHIHAVHMVGGEHRHPVGPMRLDEIEVLVDRVRGTLEPPAERVRARQQHLDRAFAIGEPGRPRRGDVLDERFGLVLREHVDRRDARVHEVAQHEIHEAIAASERQRRLRFLGREWIEPRAFAAGKHHRDDVHSWRPFSWICFDKRRRQ
jgi:hypothetical protein